MSEQTSNIVSKVWGMCGPLRDDGVSYGDYLEQITYLIFLKMANEYSKPPYKRDSGIPEGFTWADMSDLKGVELEEQYKATLERRYPWQNFQGCYQQNQQCRYFVPCGADDWQRNMGGNVL